MVQLPACHKKNLLLPKIIAFCCGAISSLAAVMIFFMLWFLLVSPLFVHYYQHSHGQQLQLWGIVAIVQLLTWWMLHKTGNYQIRSLNQLFCRNEKEMLFAIYLGCMLPLSLLLLYGVSLFQWQASAGSLALGGNLVFFLFGQYRELKKLQKQRTIDVTAAECSTPTAEDIDRICAASSLYELNDLASASLPELKIKARSERPVDLLIEKLVRNDQILEADKLSQKLIDLSTNSD